MVEFRNIGEPLGNHGLSTAYGRAVLRAIKHDSNFELIEVRRISVSKGDLIDILIVDCLNQEIGPNNAAGIKCRERLAFVFSTARDHEPEVHPLRADFPQDLLHLNSPVPGIPPTLCLNQQKWEHTSRSWTAQKFLEQILRWLTGTANGDLHPADQAVEQVYFEPEQTIILPPKFEEQLEDPNVSLAFFPTDPNDSRHRFMRAMFVPLGPNTNQISTTFAVAIQVAPRVHGQVKRIPLTLGELDGQLATDGEGLVVRLFERLRRRFQGGAVRAIDERCVLLVSIPIRRTAGGLIERIERRAYDIPVNRCELGQKLGVLLRDPESGQFFIDVNIGHEPMVRDHGWRDLELIAMGIRGSLTPDLSLLASGISPDTASFSGVLAGVGALGSALAEIWSRESWGKWTYVDHDHLEPHNIVRHIAPYGLIGYSKAKAVKYLTEGEHAPGEYSCQSVAARAADADNAELTQAFDSAELWVDTTTTISVPRSLAARPRIPRGCSAFFTPAGQDSVLLFEPANQNIRLDGLEAQYYRAILQCAWGEAHLDGHAGVISVGAGCRDMSFVMAADQVQLHAAILARQIRILKEQPDGRISIWRYEPISGAVSAIMIPVLPLCAAVYKKWRIVWDEGIKYTLGKLRNAKLPVETGGIIVGYVDYVCKTVYVVDVFPAPSDSIENGHEFIRGVTGLPEARKRAADLTAGIVDYIGEWHSHPRFCSIKASSHDRMQQTELARELGRIGQPFLTIIVGDEGENIQVTESDL